MKIVLGTSDRTLFDTFYVCAQKYNYELITVSSESAYFDYINSDEVDGYVISIDEPFFKKITDFIKKKHPYVPVIAITTNIVNNSSDSVDIFMSIPVNKENFVLNVVYTIKKYKKNFSTLQKLTEKIKDKIIFENCTYDPITRTLFYKGKEIKKLSRKEGGILELLTINYNKVVLKDIILEKIWNKTDYFANRSMDVYVTHLRNIFKENKLNFIIKNMGSGLILKKI